MWKNRIFDIFVFIVIIHTLYLCVKLYDKNNNNCRMHRYFYSDPDKIVIYIDEPPDKMSEKDWDFLIRYSCSDWFFDSGLTLVIAKDKKDADLIFESSKLNKNVFGQCECKYNPIFPHLPTKAYPIKIVIAKDIKDMGGSNPLKTLRHEIGHAVGLPHRSESVMSIGGEFVQLTKKDREDVIKLNKYIKGE